MSLHRAGSAGPCADGVRQGLFEVHDLRECLEFAMEELGKFPAFRDPLDQGIKTIYQAMRDGNYLFRPGDLPFMELADKHAQEIPFHVRLKQINQTHRRGLDVD